MNWMRFDVTEGDSLSGSLIFSREEDSFRFDEASSDQLWDRVGDAGVTSLLVEFLHIEIAVEGGVGLFVWGYHPRLSWIPGVANPSGVGPGYVSAVTDSELIRGVSERLVEPGDWTTIFDLNSGWVRVTADVDSMDEQVVAIADQTCLGLIEGQLNSLWLRPTFKH